jgi:hypothetical protein
MIWLPFPTIIPVNASNMNYCGLVFGAVMLGDLATWFIWGHRHRPGPNKEIVKIVMRLADTSCGISSTNNYQFLIENIYNSIRYKVHNFQNRIQQAPCVPWYLWPNWNMPLSIDINSIWIRNFLLEKSLNAALILVVGTGGARPLGK